MNNQAAQTNLNLLFQELIINFAHLITRQPQTKSEFLNQIKKTYCLSNSKTSLFYAATENSTFETIRKDHQAIYFNQ